MTRALNLHREWMFKRLFFLIRKIKIAAYKVKPGELKF